MSRVSEECPPQVSASSTLAADLGGLSRASALRSHLCPSHSHGHTRTHPPRASLICAWAPVGASSRVPRLADLTAEANTLRETITCAQHVVLCILLLGGEFVSSASHRQPIPIVVVFAESQSWSCYCYHCCPKRPEQFSLFKKCLSH